MKSLLKIIGFFELCSLNATAMFGARVIFPFLAGCGRRIYAAIFSFMAGVMPPMPMLGRLLWIAHTGCPWRDLPSEFGGWNTVFIRFHRWVKTDAVYRMLRVLADYADFDYAIIDGNIFKVNHHGRGAKGGHKSRPSGALAAV